MGSGVCSHHLVLLIVLVVANLNYSTLSRLPEFRRRNESSQRAAELKKQKETRAPEFTPKTVETPTSLVVEADNEVNLPCDVYGRPEPVMQWKKNRKMLENADERSNGVYDFSMIDWSLTLRNVVPADSGNYTCIRSNAYGTVRRVYDLRVIARDYHIPIITGELLRNKTILLNESSNLTCSYVTGFLTFTVTWVKHTQKNGRWKDRYSGVEFIDNLKREETPDRKQSQLALNRVKWKDSGWYSCHVKNVLGTATADFWITVTDEILNETAAASVGALVQAEENAKFWVVLAVCLILVVTIVTMVVVVVTNRNRKWLVCGAKRREPGTMLTRLGRRVEIDARHSLDVTAPCIRIVSPDPPYAMDPSVLNEVAIPVDSHWELNRAQVELSMMIGGGEFGEVWSAQYWRAVRSTSSRPADMRVAVKILKSPHNESDLVAFVTEMEVMKQIWRRQGGHDNIVNLIGCCTQDGGPVMLVMDLCKYGNLRDFLRKRRRSFLEGREREMDEHLCLEDVVSFGLQIAEGMNFLESCRCLHRDLAARNIMIDSKPTKNPLATGYVAKIGDFGLAKRLYDRDYYHRRTAGRLPVKWMAPECFVDRTFSFYSDVWSYGILLWEIMSMGSSPYPAILNPQDVFTFINGGGKNTEPPGCPPVIYELMTSCWQLCPTDRPSFKEAIEAISNFLRTSSSAQLAQLYPRDASSSGEYVEEDEMRKVILKSASAPAFTDYLLLMQKR